MMITTHARYLGIRTLKKKDGSGFYSLLHILPLEGVNDDGTDRYSFNTILAYVPSDKVSEVSRDYLAPDLVSVTLRLTERKDSVSWAYVSIADFGVKV